MQKSAMGGASLLVPPAVAQVTPKPNRGTARESGNPAGSAVNDSAILENELVRIVVSAASGDITGLYHKRTGKEYIAAKQWARAFRLNVPFPKRVTGYLVDYSANSLDSWRQTKGVITKEKDAGSQMIKVQYPALESEAGKFEIELRYSIRLPNNSDEAILQLELTNHSPYPVKEVFFPWISGVGAIEGAQTDALVFPDTMADAETLRRANDLTNANTGNWEEYPYLFDLPGWPGGLSMPWMNYGGKQEGLYLGSLSRECILHMLMVQNFSYERDPILGFAWAFPPYITPGRSWRTPQIVLSLHNGDWHAAADKYRASLDSWYQKPDTPPEFKQAFASFNSLFTRCDFVQITELAEDIRKYGLRDLVMWNFGDYYPEVMEDDDLSLDPPRLGLFTPQWGGLARLRTANEKAQSLGVRTGIIFNQRLWNKDTLTPELRKLAEKWVIRRESGDPLTESWHHQHLGAAQWSYEQQYFGNLEYQMCNAVEDWQEFAITNIVGVLSRAGYSTMFLDEAVEARLCFNAEHHHPDVSAPCIATYDFLKSLKAAIREMNPEAVLWGEHLNLIASQFVDMAWGWGLPPNPEITRYTLPWTLIASAVGIDPAIANKYFVLGIHLAIVARSLENGKKLSDFPDFAHHLSRLATFHKKTERFWTDGAFQDDVGLRVSGGFGKVYKTGEEVAVMVANLTPEPAEASFELDSHCYAITSASFFAISSSQPSENGRAEKAVEVLKGRRHLSQYEVVALVFRRAPQP